MSPLLCTDLKISAAAHGLLRLVGNTPLVNLSSLAELPQGSKVLAKLEYRNPGGSIKDRPVARMLTRALSRGLLEGRTLLDFSTGNAGVAYAQFGAALGVPVTLVIQADARPESLDRMRAHGARLVLTDPRRGQEFAVREALRLARENPDLYWYCDQRSNEENWRAHYATTAPEILAQVALATGGAPGAFVAGVGTGGTLTGVARRLRESVQDLLVAAVVPVPGQVIEGLWPKPAPGEAGPLLLDESLIDSTYPISSESALRWTKRLARAGMFVGPSSGANLAAAFDLARAGAARVVVTTLNDGGVAR